MIPPLSVAVPPATTFLSPIRALVTSWLGTQHLKADRWCLVVTELVTNSISVSEAASVVTIDLRLDGSEVELVVSDAGPGLDLGPISEPDPSAPRGRGLLIVDALTTDLTAERHDSRTIIRCRRPLADDRMPPPIVVEPADAGPDNSGSSGSTAAGSAPGTSTRAESPRSGSARRPAEHDLRAGSGNGSSSSSADQHR